MRQLIQSLEKANAELRVKTDALQTRCDHHQSATSTHQQEFNAAKQEYEAKLVRLREEANEAKLVTVAECQSLKDQLAAKTEENQRWKFEKEKLGQQVGILEAQAKNFGRVDNQVLDGMAIAKEAYTKGMDSLLQRIDSQQNQLASLLRENQEVREAKKQLEGEKADLESKLSLSRETEKMATAATGERDQFKDEYQRVSSQLEITREKLSLTEKHLEEYRSRVERTERESLEATAALRDVTCKEGETSKTRDELRIKLAKAIGTAEIQTGKLDNLRERFEEAEAERKELRIANRAVVAEREELTDRVGKQSNEIKALQAELQTINDAYQVGMKERVFLSIKM